MSFYEFYLAVFELNINCLFGIEEIGLTLVDYSLYEVSVLLYTLLELGIFIISYDEVF